MVQMRFFGEGCAWHGVGTVGIRIIGVSDLRARINCGSNGVSVRVRMVPGLVVVFWRRRGRDAIGRYRIAVSRASIWRRAVAVVQSALGKWVSGIGRLRFVLRFGVGVRRLMMRGFGIRHTRGFRARAGVLGRQNIDFGLWLAPQ